MYIYLYISKAPRPGAPARGPWPRAQDMLHTWGINSMLGMSLWKPFLFKYIYIYMNL